jgi:hypothetical protein
MNKSTIFPAPIYVDQLGAQWTGPIRREWQGHIGRSKKLITHFHLMRKFRMIHYTFCKIVSPAIANSYRLFWGPTNIVFILSYFEIRFLYIGFSFVYLGILKLGGGQAYDRSNE